MLWQGPLTTLYGRANEIMFPMPEEEKSDWKLVRSASNGCEFLDTCKNCRDCFPALYVSSFRMVAG